MEKYWSDYAKFIQVVERNTGYSPSHLINGYAEFLRMLEEADYDDSFPEWEDYFLGDIFLREMIQKLFDDESLKDNLVFLDFKKQVEEVDEKMRRFLINPEKADWWVNLEIDFSKINKAS